MSACWNHRPIRYDSDENRACIAVSAHLVQAISVCCVVDLGAVVNSVRRVSVVINLNKLVARTGWSTRSQFTDQDCSWLTHDQDRAGGGIVHDGRTHWIRQHNEQPLVAFTQLGIREDRDRDGLDLVAL